MIKVKKIPNQCGAFDYTVRNTKTKQEAWLIKTYGYEGGSYKSKGYRVQADNEVVKYGNYDSCMRCAKELVK